MKVWDMHCDTLAELRYAQQAGKPKSFLHNDLMMDLERMKQGDYLLQCMACFVHLEPEREKSPLLACLEEIAYENGWIDRDYLLERAKYFGKTGYGQYLYSLAGETQ